MSDEIKKCPFCAEEINIKAIKCRFCGEALRAEDSGTKPKLKPCPICAEDIPIEEKQCPLCDSLLQTPSPPQQANWREKAENAKQAFILRNDAILNSLSNGNASKKKKLIYAEIGAGILLVLILCFLIFGGESVDNVNIPPGRPDHQLLEYTSLGDLRAVKYLVVKLKADPNAAVYSNNNKTALHVAIESKFPDIALYLIAKKAEVDAEDSSGNTPLSYAITTEQYQIADVLLKRGAKKDEMFGAVIYAVTENKPDLLKYLLKKKFPVEVIDSEKTRNTPLHLAVQLDHPEMVKMLLKTKLDRNAGNADGNTALHIAVQAFKFSHLKNPQNKYMLECAKLLAEAGADVNAKNNAGLTPLQLAGTADVLKYLFSKGAKAEPNIDDCRLSWIFRSGYGNEIAEVDAELIDLLVRAGANADIKPDGSLMSWDNNPLVLAVRGNNIEVVEALLKHNADASIAMQTAAGCRNEKIVRMLIERGVHLGPAAMRGITEMKDYRNLLTQYLKRGGKITAKEYEIWVQISPASPEWNELVAKGTESVSWNGLFAITESNPSLAGALLDKVDDESTDMIEGVVKRILKSKNDELIQKMVTSKAMIKSSDFVIALITSHQNDLLKQAIANGADVNGVIKRTSDRWMRPGFCELTPLFAAVEYDNPVAVSILLDAKADITRKMYRSREGTLSVLQYAKLEDPRRINGLSEMITMLEKVTP